LSTLIREFLPARFSEEPNIFGKVLILPNYDALYWYNSSKIEFQQAAGKSAAAFERKTADLLDYKKGDAG